jgi:hypothetical protein
LTLNTDLTILYKYYVHVHSSHHGVNTQLDEYTCIALLRVK